MPKFYIHFRNASGMAEDDVGQDLPGLEQAKAAALVSAREMLADDIKHNSADPLLEVIVADEAGRQATSDDPRQGCSAGRDEVEPLSRSQ